MPSRTNLVLGFSAPAEHTAERLTGTVLTMGSVDTWLDENKENNRSFPEWQQSYSTLCWLHPVPW